MKTLSRTFLLLMMACWLAACTIKAGWNQKMTIEVETPDGLKTASSVLHVNAFTSTRLWRYIIGAASSGSSVSYQVTGEAVVLDLGQGKYLFALLKGAANYFSEPGRNAMAYFADMERYYKKRAKGANFPIEEVANAPRNQPVELNPNGYPLLVTFTDINDPRTVKQVDQDDLDGALGCSRSQAEPAPWRDAGVLWFDWQQMSAAGMSAKEYRESEGNNKRTRAQRQAIAEVYKRRPVRDTANDCYRIKSITLEITDEPMSVGGVEGLFPCLKEYQKECIPLNREFEYGHPMRSIRDEFFLKKVRK